MIEKVGKITLDYSLYPGEDLYCDGDIEQEILKIVKEYPSVDFPKIQRTLFPARFIVF